MLLKGNCLELLAEMPDNSVDSIVTDPPYELGFMGKSWDNSGIAYNVELWSQALRVLKPGGHLLAFGGSRTYHRLASAIEDAGFEIRDQIMYLYGSGFPKSHNVSKAIDKNNGESDRLLRFVKWMKTTGLKAGQINQAIEKADVGSHYLRLDQPAIPTAELWAKLRPLIADVPEWVDELVNRIEAEREVVGTKPSSLGGTVAAGERNQEIIDYHKNKIVDITAPATDAAKQWDGWGTALKPAHEPIVVARKPLIGTVATNVLTYGTGALNIDGSRVGTDGGTKDITKGEGIKSNKVYGTYAAATTVDALVGRWPANVIHDGSEEVLEGFPNTKGVVRKPTGKGILNPETGWNANSMIDTTVRGFADSGSAARFFYCAKASKSERNAGLEGLPERKSDTRSDVAAGLWAQMEAPKANFHPTVKPLALMRYLVKLVTPPNGTVLDPFLGSGTTAVATILEGFNWMGCEMTEDYWPIIEARVAWAELQPKTLL